MRQLFYLILMVFPLIAGCQKLLPNGTSEDQTDIAETSRSVPGKNIWNRGTPPVDWWADIERYHGHVGPWNVLGWRMGQAVLRDFEAQWGDHTLNIVAFFPIDTPYSCLIEGLMVGTGNSPGRLDLGFAPAEGIEKIEVLIVPKDIHQDRAMLLRPSQNYLGYIYGAPANKVESLAFSCASRDEALLFDIQWIGREQAQARLDAIETKGMAVLSD